MNRSEPKARRPRAPRKPRKKPADLVIVEEPEIEPIDARQLERDAQIRDAQIREDLEAQDLANERALASGREDRGPIEDELAEREAIAAQEPLDEPLQEPPVRQRRRRQSNIREEDAVAAELIRAGYIPKDRVIMDDSIYVKAYNPMGQKIFILLDAEAIAYPSDLTLTEVKQGVAVPHSVKMGTLELAGMAISGVAFVCEEGICMVTRDAESNPHEKNYIIVGKHADKTMILEGNPIAYPVIRLSEIRANPDLVLKNTDIAAKKIRNAAYSTSLTMLDSMKANIERLHQAFNEFVEEYKTSSRRLSSSIGVLESIHTQYLNPPPTTAEELEKLHKIKFNQLLRNDMVVDSLRQANGVIGLENEVNRLTGDINSMTQALHREFEKVENVYDE